MLRKRMDLIRDRENIMPRPRPEGMARPEALASLLLAPGTEHQELPALSELTAATTALAMGHKRKALIPLGTAPTEFALVRRGERVLISSYETGSVPEVHQLDHNVGLSDLLNACARATLDRARYETDPTARQIAVRMAERALRTPVSHDSQSPDSVLRQGGCREGNDEALAFGFEARFFPATNSPGRVARADVHAMLFEGQLWAFVHGRRLMLGQGPIMLIVQRMVVAVRNLIDAWEAGRTTNVRLRSGNFGIALRLDGNEEVHLSLHRGQQQLRAISLDVASAALPILRLTSDLLRALVGVDRNQSRNLRVNALREEVRQLRRIVRDQARHESFVNSDPDRLRLGMLHEKPEQPETHRAAPPAAGLRFDERWRIALDGLDASSVYYCGDRLVLATPHHTVAVDRSSGDVLWAREGAATTFMAGSTLVRLSPEGDVELCGVDDGEAIAHTRIAPRVGGTSVGTTIGGGALPPMVVLAEAASRLVAIDLRTGEPRWRFSSRRGGNFRLRKAGRLLLVTCDGVIHALDIASGEDVWRFAARHRFSEAPAVIGDVAVVAGDSGRPTVHGLDLLTGEELWSRRLEERICHQLVGAAGAVLVPLERDQLLALDPHTGTPLWESADPGLGLGAAPLVVDNVLITNAPGGCLSGTDLGTGELLWTHLLGDPLSDEVPRRLEPILRGGALFVPASGVYMLRPQDGAPLGELPCDLVPDRIRVDERGWVYVAEESGHLAAYAPSPQLRMIRGGA